MGEFVVYRVNLHLKFTHTIFGIYRVGRSRGDDRLMVTAMLSALIKGIEWKELPQEFGQWKTIYNRLCNWCDDGTFTSIIEILKEDID